MRVDGSTPGRIRTARLGAALAGAALLVGWGAVVQPGVAGAPTTCQGLPATIIGTDGDDEVFGTAERDVVSLGEGDDSFEGGTGDDVVCGGPGDDTLFALEGVVRLDGGKGDDRLQASSGVVRGGHGNDTLEAVEEEVDGLDVDLGPDADLARLDSLHHATVRGSAGDDTFEVIEPGWGGLDADGTHGRLLGGKGEDVLSFAGNSHRIRIDVRAGTATWSQGDLAFAHVNEFHGSTNDDVVRGTPEDDRLFGHAGDDRLVGGGGPDLLVGGAGRDVAYGGPGRDTCSAERRFSCA